MNKLTMHLPIALIATLISLTGCAVREQAFGCKGLTSDAQSDEFVMIHHQPTVSISHLQFYSGTKCPAYLHPA